MIKLIRPIFMTILGCGLCWGTPKVARGQDVFDFDKLDEQVADEEPAAAETPTQEATTAPADAAATPATEESGVVQAIRQSAPETPTDLMRSIDQLIRIGRPDAAAEYLDRLVKLSLDDAALAELYREFGTATMIRLARTSELAPQSNEFSLAMMQAAQRILRDPRRLAQWVDQLGAADRTTRYRAAEQLLRAGPSAVPSLIEGLATADAARQVQRDWGFAVLERMGRDALEPLYGYLAAKDTQRRPTAIAALGRIGLPESLPYLVGPLFVPRGGEAEQQATVTAWQRIASRVPDRHSALKLLTQEADRAYRGQAGTAADPDDQVTRWTWDVDTQRPVATPMRTADAAALKAARLYGDVVRLSPDDNAARQRYLISRLEFDQVLGGLDQPLRDGEGTAFDLVRQAQPAWVSQLLQVALDDQHDAAAMGAAEVLGELKDVDTLHRRRPDATHAAPLVQALSHPNRRVRFAAARAIARIRPSGSFDGAGRLADVLQYFASSQGQRAAVIAHPNLAMASNLAGMLSARGFRTTTVTSAHELEKAATSTADVELLWVSDALNDASLWSTLEELRVNPKTARLPIAILARANTQAAAARIAEAHRRVLVLGEAMDDVTLDAELPRLLALADRDATTPTQRSQQAQAAMKMFHRLVTGNPPADIDLELRVPALVDRLGAPDLVRDTLDVLGHTASQAAQLALLDFASQTAAPVAERQAAADAFRESVSHYGVLLNQAQIDRQYDRYNQSRDLDRPTQVLLGAILDTLEEPRQAESATR